MVTTLPADAETPRAEPTLTVGELFRISGVAASAIRFYEKHGLVVSTRTAGNQRRFYEVEAAILNVIRVAQGVGLSVADVRALMCNLPDRALVTCTDWLVLRHRLEQEVRTRLQTLHAALDELTSEVKLCEIRPRS